MTGTVCQLVKREIGSMTVVQEDSKVAASRYPIQDNTMKEVEAVIEFYKSKGWCWLFIVEYMCNKSNRITDKIQADEKIA